MESNYKDSPVKWSLLISFVGLIIIIATFAWWNFAPVHLITYGTPYKTDKTAYYQGDYTSYTVEYCRSTDIAPFKIQKSFVDGIIFNAEESKAEFSKGCHTQVIPLHIPETLPAGRYRLRVIASYEVNPIKNVSYTNETNWFEVKSRVVEQVNTNTVDISKDAQ